MSNASIRQASMADADNIAAFNIAMALQTEGRALDPDRVGAGVRSLLSDSAKGFYLVCEKDGEVVGQLMVTFEWSDWRNGVFWWIQSVYVKPAHRRQGIYRALYETLKEMAHTTDEVCGIRLYVEHDNATAQKTYRDLGMKEAPYAIHEVDFVLG
jgi:ribosomal protein S18 acetylase RimI-like enzyme